MFIITPSFIWRSLFIVAILLWLGYRLIQFLKFVKKFNKFPRLPIPLSSVFLGHFYHYLYRIKFKNCDSINEKYFHIIDSLEKIARQEDHSIFSFWLINQPRIVILSANMAEKILASNTMIDKSLDYDMLKPWLSEGLLTSAGNKWRRRRKLLTPAFHFNILDEFLVVMNEQANILLQIIEEKRTQSPTKFMNIVPLMLNAALDVIAETAMGVKIGSQKNLNKDYVQIITRISSKALKRMISPWLRSNWIFFNFFSEGHQHYKDVEFAHKFTMDVIYKRKQKILESRNSNNNMEEMSIRKRRLAFMDLLIEEHLKYPKEFTLADIREEVDTFMFEGHDTTAMSMIWTLYLLGNHPQVQQQVQEEIDLIRAEKDSDEEGNTTMSWTMDQLRKMKYLECCIKESLRLYPSVPMIARVADQDTDVGNGLIIPKDAYVVLPVEALQRDPKFFTKPQHFIPERFLEGSPENQGKVNPFAHVPFSAGPRNCIGQKFALQEEKVLLASILHRYRIKSELPVGEAIKLPELILRPKHDINIQFVPRF